MENWSINKVYGTKALAGADIAALVPETARPLAAAMLAAIDEPGPDRGVQVQASGTYSGVQGYTSCVLTLVGLKVA